VGSDELSVYNVWGIFGATIVLTQIIKGVRISTKLRIDEPFWWTSGGPGRQADHKRLNKRTGVDINYLKGGQYHGQYNNIRR
jgi:hypothetical protein